MKYSIFLSLWSSFMINRCRHNRYAWQVDRMSTVYVIYQDGSIQKCFDTDNIICCPHILLTRVIAKYLMTVCDCVKISHHWKQWSGVKHVRQIYICCQNHDYWLLHVKIITLMFVRYTMRDPVVVWGYNKMLFIRPNLLSSNVI